MQISRMFQILYILLECERVTAPQLAQKLEVSVRTIYRDIDALCEAGIPLYTEQGRGGGVSILPEYTLSASLLSCQERQSILSALQSAVETGAQDLSILRKLRAHFGQQEQNWVKIDFSDWSGSQNVLLPVLKQAILEKRIVEMDYYAESGEMHMRQVCPLLLWFKGQAWYLRAYCLTRNAVRTFKLSRLKRPRIIPGSFPPQALAAHENDAVYGKSQQPLVHLLLHAESCMAYRVYDDFAEESILRQSDGSFIISAAFPPGEWIKAIIFSYGEHIEVLEPPSLRAQLCSELKNMIEKYKT